MKQYGHFDTQGRYVITDPHTPEPWLHYLIRVDQPGTETFASGVTYAGGGFDVRGTHENSFVDTKLHLTDEDNVGRYTYIKDETDGELWSTMWQPVRNPKQSYRATLGFGSMNFEAACANVEARTTMFVPRNFDGWVQNIRLENKGAKAKKLSVYPFVPVHMGNALVRLLAGDNDAMFGGTKFDKDLNGIVFRRHHGTSVKDRPEDINGMLGNVALYYSTLNAATKAADKDVQYETTTERFFGDRFHGYGDPEAIRLGQLSNKDTPYLRRPCGVFKHEIELGAGEVLEFAVVFVAGSTADYYQNKKTELRSIIALVAEPSSREAMLRDVEAWWEAHMGKMRLQSPDPKLDRAFRWLQYQCQIVYVLNRMKSRFHTGYEYGWGFRDILQDVLFVLPYDTVTMASALKHISTQIFSSGVAYHNFFIDQPGNKSIEASDDPIWFPAAVIKYCKETGNFAFLDELSDYADVREGSPGVRGSILEHCTKAVDRVWADRSSRGLPFMKDCDWNDDLNELRVGSKWNDTVESVMVAQQLYKILVDMADLFEASGREAGLAPVYRERARELKKAIYTHCLDKEGYFKRALVLDPHNGEDLGHSGARYGKIYLEPQAFAILSGLCDQRTSNMVLDAVEKNLDSDFGAMLCYPFYTDLAWDDVLPTKTWNIEKEPPGMKENGGIFMHLNAWLVQAYCMAGRGKDAVALYLKTMPENMARDPDNYRTEPYVYPEYVRGTDSDQFGRGGHTWLTGTAPTMHTALTEFIFGLRPDYRGLVVDPCVDPQWSSFSMTRTWRGATYQIAYRNPKAVEKGVESLVVDGRSLPVGSDKQAVLPEFGDGKIHLVEIIMG